MATDKKGILARARAAARETTAVTDEGLRAYMLKSITTWRLEYCLQE